MIHYLQAKNDMECNMKSLWQLSFFLLANLLFCTLVSVVCHCRLPGSVTLQASGPTGRRDCVRSGGQHSMVAQYGYVPSRQHLVFN